MPTTPSGSKHKPPLIAEPQAHGENELGFDDPAFAQQMTDQALLDTNARVAGGFYIYFMLWLVITLASGLMQRFPIFVAVVAVWLGGLGLSRMLLGRHLPQLLQNHPHWAHRLLVSSALCNGLSWGLLTAAAVYLPELEPVRWAMLLVAVGLSSAGTYAMAINPLLKRWFPIVVILPISIATALTSTRGNWLLAGLTAVYSLYVMHSSRIVSRDYWKVLHAHKLLEQRSKELERASLTDTLTQVPNRLHFDRHYAMEWGRACRQGGSLAVMVVDLDHFKKINDGYGHAAGDLVLKQAAQAMREALMRPCDIVARYGGEEFAVLLPDTSPEGAAAVAERLRERVAELELEFDGRPLRATCSVGYAWSHPTQTDQPAALIKQADTALYEAKESGRNRTCSADALAHKTAAKPKPAETATSSS